MYGALGKPNPMVNMSYLPPLNGPNAWLESVYAFIDAELDNSQLSVLMLAEEFELSARQLQRRLRSACGESPAEFIRNRRLDKARQYLIQGRFMTVKETAGAVGFRDSRYFSEQFKLRFGRLPSEIR